jgi:hypothetical protein
MSKAQYLQDDNGALSERGVQAEQAEAASSGATAVARTSAPALSSGAAAAPSQIAAGSATAASPVVTAPAAVVTAAPAASATGPLNAPSALSNAAVVDAATAHGYSEAELAAGSAALLQDIKTGPLGKFDTHLAALAVGNAAGTSAAMSAAASMVGQFTNTLSTDAHGVEYVTIDARAADGNGAALLAQLEGLGSAFHNGASYGGIASGQVAVSQLMSVLNLSDLASAHEAAHTTNAGLVTSQAVHAQGVDIADAQYGLDGSGLKIGVLSDSFDATHSVGINGQPDTMATDIATGDLPTNTTVLQDYSGGADEGRAMAQLIHDIAPGAAIEFATADTGEAGFASNILQLAADGAREIVDDVTYFYEPAFQNGIISQAVNSVSASGITYFSSAGNDFDAGWTGAVNLSATAVTTASLFTNLAGAPNETVHLQQFASGENYIPLSDPSDAAAGFSGFHYNDSYYIDVQWSDPDSDAAGQGVAGGGPGPTTDFDIFVYDATTKTVLGYSADNNAETGDPIEVIALSRTPTIGDDVRIYVGATTVGATLPAELKVISEGDGLPYVLGDANTDATALTFETSYGHNAAPGAISVGAASYTDTPGFGTMTPINEFYSSDGAGVTLYYDDNGNRLATPEVLQKVDVTAVDNVDNTFFGGDSDGDGFANFSGTSAAAPDAAAVGLLMLQANPNLTPDDIRHLEMDSAVPMQDLSGTTYLDGQARDDFFVGYNGTAGAGLIQADAAVGFVETGVIENPYQDALYGTSAADTIVGGTLSEVLEGFGGADHIIIGSGETTVVYASVTDSTVANYDTLTGFQTGYDVIDLRAVDNGAVAIVNTSSGGSEVLFDVAGGSYQGLIYSESPVTASDLYLSANHQTVIYGSPNGGAIYGDATARQYGDYLISQGGKTDFYGTDTADLMTGGSGKDTFHYLDVNAASVSAGAVDQIYGFTSGVDKIDLTGISHAVGSDGATPQIAVDTIVIDHVGGASYVTWNATAVDADGAPSGSAVANEIYVDGVVQGGDILTSGQGVYVVGGGEGDTLVGSTNNDILIAGSGTETLTGGIGQDIIYAGSGHDTFVFSGAQDSSISAPDYIENFVSGSDVIDLSAASGSVGMPEIVYGSNGYSYLYFASNTSGGFSGEIVANGQVQVSDVNTGSSTTPFTLVGAAANETLIGGGGADVIHAGSAANTVHNITGGGGADVLYAGAAGQDIFHYTAFSDSNPNAVDVILGFKSGTDLIDLSGLQTGAIDINYANGYSYIYYGLNNGTYQGEIAVQGTVVSSDIETSSASSVFVDAASTDAAAMHLAQQALASHPTTNIFGH